MSYVREAKLVELRALVSEGGAVGHLSHLTDNPELTFSEIKEIISSAADGKLERASEKLDGINLVFTYTNGQLRVARSGGDIKGGGMDATALAKKFFGRGNVEEAFNSAFKVLEDAVSALSPADVEAVFGAEGNRWYSLEIVYAPAPNTINYDSNNIVFHGWPVFEVGAGGSVTKPDDDTGISTLTSKIDQMQKAVKATDWRVRGPSLVSMKQLSDGSVKQGALVTIDSAMSAAGVSDDDTLLDYLRSLMKEEVAALGLPKKAAVAIVERCVEAPGCPSVNDIKKMVKKEDQQAVSDFVKAAVALRAKMIAPVEQAIYDFAAEVLKGVKSTLIDDSDAEVVRLRTQVTKAIGAIKSSGNATAMDVLQKELGRLGDIEKIAPVEGVVFFYKGQAYKFTASFASVNAILGLFKYGRKGVPKMDMGESFLNRRVNAVLDKWERALS